jgi:hypothetical protein
MVGFVSIVPSSINSNQMKMIFFRKKYIGMLGIKNFTHYLVEDAGSFFTSGSRLAPPILLAS